MRKQIVAASVMACLLGVVACVPGTTQAQTANTVLTDTGKALEASQLLCILVSQYVSVPAIATACNIDAALLPSVEQVLAALDTVVAPAVAVDAGVGVALPVTLRHVMLAALAAKGPVAALDLYTVYAK
jgi:hypothetical protein